MGNVISLEVSTLFQIVGLLIALIGVYIKLQSEIVKLQSENEATKERLNRKDKYDDDLRKKVDEIYNLLISKRD